MTIDQILDSGMVMRYHAESLAVRQTLSQHQWGVALIIMQIVKHPSAALLMAALTHDIPERVIGDMPLPFKLSHPDVSKLLDAAELRVAFEWGIADYQLILGQEDLATLHLADYLEAASFCYAVYKQGAKRGLEIFQQFYTYLPDLGLLENERALDLFNQMVRSINHPDIHPLVP